MKLEIEIEGLNGKAKDKEKCKSAILLTDNGCRIALQCDECELMLMYLTLIQTMANVMRECDRKDLKDNLKILEGALWDTNGFRRTIFGAIDISKSKEYKDYSDVIEDMMEVKVDD